MRFTQFYKKWGAEENAWNRLLYYLVVVIRIFSFLFFHSCFLANQCYSNPFFPYVCFFFHIKLHIWNEFNILQRPVYSNRYKKIKMLNDLKCTSNFQIQTVTHKVMLHLSLFYRCIIALVNPLLNSVLLKCINISNLYNKLMYFLPLNPVYITHLAYFLVILIIWENRHSCLFLFWISWIT